MWDLVRGHLSRDPRLAASKEELWLRIQEVWNGLPQAGIQNLFDFMPRRSAAIIVLLGDFT